MILDVWTHTVHHIKADILVKETGHALQGSKDFGRVSMDGEASFIP